MSTSQLIKNLEKIYYDIKEPSSFRGKNNLLQTLKSKNLTFKEKDVVEWLTNQQTYGIHQKPKFNFKRNQIVSGYIDHIWSADLIEIEHSKANDDYRYILMIIDNLSKYGWAIPLLDKKAETVKRAILKIIRETRRKPTIFATDAGKEFTNRSLKKYFKWRKIKHLVMRDQNKAVLVERWNQTIKNKIYKYLSFKKTKRFIDVLDHIVSGYNNTLHSRTKFKPSQVEKSNEEKVFRNLYRIKTTLETSKFKKGDKVRAILLRSLFEKGYKENFSKEIFFIHKIYNTSPYKKYKLIDKKGNILRGSYYSNELFKIK